MLPLSTLLSLSLASSASSSTSFPPLFFPASGSTAVRAWDKTTVQPTTVRQFSRILHGQTPASVSVSGVSLSLSVYLSFVCSIDPLPLPAQREYRLTPASIVDDWKYAISTSGKLIKGSPTQLLGRIISHPRRVRMRAEREIESFEDFRRFRGIFFFVRNKVKARVLVHSFLTTHTFLRFSCRKS